MIACILRLFLCGLLIGISAACAAADVLLVLGDSLSAAYGMAQSQGWVSLLDKRLVEQRADCTVVNASISGETSSGGRSRLQALLDRHRPRIVMIELGANDGLRGLPLGLTESNLDHMLSAVRQAGAQPILIGIKLPRNYGEAFNSAFEAMYARLARRHHIATVPFLLDGLPAESFQADGLHPKAEAQTTVMETVWVVLRPQLDKRSPRKGPRRS